MIRTQIYLDEEIHKELIALAKQEKASMAKLARDILKEGIESELISNFNVIKFSNSQS